MNIYSPSYITYLQNSCSLRMKRIEERAAEISKQMGRRENFSVRIYHDVFPIESIAVNTEYNVIFIPAMNLLSLEEFPENLTVSGFDDSKLNDDQYFKELSYFIHQIFPKTLLSDEITWEEKRGFIQYLEFMRDPLMAQRATDFCLHHEVGHVFLRHKKHKKLILIFSALISLLAANVFSLVLTIVPLLFIAFLVFIVSSAVLKVVERRAQEKEADIIAIKTSKDIDAALYFLSHIKETQKRIKQSKDVPFSKKYSITNDGDNIKMALSHDIESNRMSYLIKEHARLQNPV